MRGVDHDSPETARVAEMLAAVGFQVQPHLAERAGQKSPDLFISAPSKFWVEVKAIDSQPEVRAFDTARQIVEGWLSRHPVDHSMHLYVNSNATSADYKFLLTLTNSVKEVGENEVFVGLSPDYSRESILHYTASTDQGTYDFIMACADPTKIFIPWQIGTVEWEARACVTDAAGAQTVPLYDLDDTLLIGARLFKGSQTGLFIMTSAEGAYQSTTTERIRKDADKANRQISDACKEYSAPGILFVVARDSLVTVQSFVTAMLGDLTVTFAVNREERDSDPAYYGKNGRFRTDHHRHLSACYLVSGEQITCLLNPFALQPIQNVLPSAQVIPVTPGGPVTIPH